VQFTAGKTNSVDAQFEGMLSCNEQDHRLELSASRPVNEERLALVVKAHQQALDLVTQQLLDQIKGTCNL